MTRVTFAMPLPDAQLSSNKNNPYTRAGQYRLSRLRRTQRQSARLRCLEAMQSLGIQDAPWASATISFHFHFSSAHPRDRGNWAEAMKSAQDGVQDAGLVANDRVLRDGETTITLRSSNPRVEIAITKEDDQ